MIKLDLTRLSRKELETVLTTRCSQFGTVTSVVIVQDSARYDFALACIDMSARDAAMEVLRRMGDSLVDGAVVIRIEQETQSR